MGSTLGESLGVDGLATMAVVIAGFAGTGAWNATDVATVGVLVPKVGVDAAVVADIGNMCVGGVKEPLVGGGLIGVPICGVPPEEAAT